MGVAAAVARILTVALCLLVVASCTRTPPAAPAAKRVLVLALDAGTWDLLDGYIERGLLPNIAKLRKGGAWGTLQSIQPSSSPVIWTTVATGKTPEKHGITFFVRFPDGPGKPVPVSRTMRKTKALWNIAGDADLDVAVIGWLITWPAEEVYGRMITDRAHYGVLKDESFPPGYLNDLAPMPVDDVVKAMPEFMVMEFDPAKLDRDSEDPAERLNFLVYDRFVRAYARDNFFLEATRRVLKDGPLPDVTFVYLRGTDDVQHGFWKFMQPDVFGEHAPSAEQAEAFGRVIERYWQWTDKAVGEILGYFPEDTFVVALSDHGAGPAVGKDRVVTSQYLHLSGSHRDNGMVILHGPGVRPGTEVKGASVYDIAPTVLAYLGLPVADDMDGEVIASGFEPGVLDDKRITTYEGEGGSEEPEPGPGAPGVVDQKILEELRSLGYIGE